MTIDNEVGMSIMFDQAGSLLCSLAALFPVGLLFLIMLVFWIRASGILEPRCAGWAAVRGIAWYGQHRTTANDLLAATSVAQLIVATAKSTALNYR